MMEGQQLNSPLRQLLEKRQIRTYTQALSKRRSELQEQQREYNCTRSTEQRQQHQEELSENGREREAWKVLRTKEHQVRELAGHKNDEWQLRKRRSRCLSTLQLQVLGSRHLLRLIVVFTTIILLARGSSAQAGVRVVEQMAGSNASIPCDVPITPSSQHVLVLWYKLGNRKTIYSFDSIGKGSVKEVEGRFDISDWGGDRVEFFPLRDPPALLLHNVTVKDESIYTCSVLISGVHYSDRTNLTVIVPPDPPTIIKSAGDSSPLSSSITYNEGATVDLTCQVKGGKPPPTVSWYWDKQLLDSSHDTVGTGVVRNRVLFGPLTRKHINARLICHASTYKLVTPLTTVLWLNVQFKPTSVKIITEDIAMRVGEIQHLQCQSVGAAPPAVLSWWLDGQQLSNDTHQIYNTVPAGGNMSLTTLILSPMIQDKGKQLECRAQSPAIEHAPLVDARELVIHYMGSVKLEINGSAEHHEEKEGGDVVLRCIVDSDPRPVLIEWYHKVGSENRRVAGTNGTELQLHQVLRNSTGVYTCVASNFVSGHSNPVVLQINYKPSCDVAGVQVLGSEKHSTVKLACKIDSSPEPRSYRWQLVSHGKRREMPDTLMNNTGNQLSILTHEPKNKFDYGLFLCWAKNDIGEQETPCKLELVSAVKPVPITNCSVSNNETHAVHIECVAVFANTLQQTFIAEVYDIITEVLLRNVSSQYPNFTIEELDPGSGFRILAYSTNLLGQSAKLDFNAFTAPLVTKSVGVLVGIVGAVIVMGLIVFVIMKLKSSKSKDKSKLKCGEPPIMMPMDERDFNHKYDGGGGKATLINFPSEPAPATIMPEKSRTEEGTTPSAPPGDVEYAEVEFANDKKSKKKRKKSKSKKKKEMKDEETEYASIDHVRTMLNSQQTKLQDQLNDELKQQQQLHEADSGKQPLIRVDQRRPSDDERGRLVLPDGALESSV